LEIHHLQNVIDGSQAAPTEKNVNGSINPEFTTWKEMNCVVLGWIQASVGASMFSLVMNHKTATQIHLLLNLH